MKLLSVIKTSKNLLNYGITAIITFIYYYRCKQVQEALMTVKKVMNSIRLVHSDKYVTFTELNLVYQLIAYTFAIEYTPSLYKIEDIFE